ncbi:hypothetical protein GQ53DRAFT_644627 [Thozetella sp. PMI_491]|nr:hypothetical protein GQ53DRAFT_644627 [Thozetella sp. PMI_491]
MSSRQSEEDDPHASYFAPAPAAETEEEDARRPPRGTPFESSLPQVHADDKAIKEYEAMRASQEVEVQNGAASRLESRRWVRGKSSIYVDAFNLALDTVLEEEAALFDGREAAVFELWRGLGYDAQYVRLFLRKTAAWHRVGRLGYYNDIADVELASASLLARHTLPAGNETAGEMQEWSLGGEFSFADSEERLASVEEAASLLSFDELKALAKEAKVQGKNKGDLLKAFCRMSAQQTGLLSRGLRRSSTHEGAGGRDADESNRDGHYLGKILATTGPLVRLSEPVLRLFERVHLVFYRSTEWTEKSLTTIILAKMARRNFPEYVVCRTANIFSSRAALLEFERAARREAEVDALLEGGPRTEADFQQVLDIFDNLAPRWRQIMAEEQRKEGRVYEDGEGGYLRRFSAAHAYTRIAHKAGYVLGRLKRYGEEYTLLQELLSQRLFHPARRGAWYQRKALLEEHYMWEVDPGPASRDPELQKKHWRRAAAATCATALQDPDCHLIHHYDLQKRLVKLERRLRIPRRLQHDFGHVELRRPEEHTVRGVQLVRDAAVRAQAGRPGGPSTKTTWVDELGAAPGEEAAHVSVEEMCLSHYRAQGWKGYHAEGGIVRTLFAYLFYDILFLYMPNVFQTAFQTCPLDLHTDAFYPTRASEINHRLVEIANGEAPRLLREVDARHRDRRTCVVGLNWDYDVDDLAELVACFDGSALAAVCKVLAQEYSARGGGLPDLLLWRLGSRGGSGESERPDGSPVGEVLFAEVKSENDRLSDTQRLWIHVLTGAGVRVALCHAVASEVREID